MADEAKLALVHDMVTEALIDGLKGQQMPDYVDPDTEEVVKGATLPPSAAIIQAATKFLKDNNITCVPSEDNKLGELQAILNDRQKRKRERLQPADVAGATEQAAWLTGQIGNA